MPPNTRRRKFHLKEYLCLIAIAVMFLGCQSLAAAPVGAPAEFPRPLSEYSSSPDAGLWEILKGRVRAEPVNLVATIIFFFAIAHTFLSPTFLRLSHRFEHQHRTHEASEGDRPEPVSSRKVSFLAVLFHFLGEIEVIFGIWTLPLLLAIISMKGWPTARDYLGRGLAFTEALFVVVIMAMSASRPVLQLAEQAMARVAALGKGSPGAWWLSILLIGPVLGSLITEPAAMTISALLLAEKFYSRGPSPKFAYATLGLLFVNVSIGGTLTHFAAPPVLMVAERWGWGLGYMFREFGWKAVIGIVAANGAYFIWFRREFDKLTEAKPGPNSPNAMPPERGRNQPVPVWITVMHILFLAWTVMNSHYPSLFIGGFLFYLGFLEATEHHQDELALRPALLVGFFLAGLVIHGGLQGWWIAPLLSRLGHLSLFFGAVVLTGFNDNAAITYLASLVPGFRQELQYAVMAGAVVGGGLTVIANAPNPAGQSILKTFFPEGISSWRLFLGALVPTVLAGAAFLLL